MPLDALQDCLDRSLEGASRLMRRLFTDGAPRAEVVADFINAAGGITVATADGNGAPHAALTIAGCADGVIYFSASPGSALLRNLRGRPSVAFTVSRPEHGLMGQGTAECLGLARDLERSFGGRLDGLVAERWEGYIYGISPSRLFFS